MNKNGFTLVSVIVAVTIMIIGVVAISNLSLASIQANEQSEQRMTAILLAKEALEGIRNIRDTNWKQNFPWNYRGQTFVGKGENDTGLGYGADFTQAEITTHLIDPGVYIIQPLIDGRSFVLAKSNLTIGNDIWLFERGGIYLFRHDSLAGGT